MKDQRDPVLQALFDAAPRASAGADFVAGVMRDIDRQRRRALIGWLALALALVPVGWWLSAPVIGTLEIAARLMPDSLIDIETAWLDQLLAPVNSVTGILGLLFLFVWVVVRKRRS